MIKLQDISLKLGNFKVNNFFMNVRSGEYYILLGPSGAGKSVILQTIAGFYKISSGKILLRGIDVTELSPEERAIGFIPQNSFLFPNLTVRENILFAANIHKIPFEKVKEFFEYLINILEIEYLLNNRVVHLSGGEKQKVAIARAMLLKPDIVLLDEPLSSLDMPLRKKIVSTLLQLHRETNITFLHVTHDQEEAFILGDVISLIFNGQIEQTSKKNALYFFPRTLNVALFTGMGNIFNGKVVSVDHENHQVTISYKNYCFVATLHEHRPSPSPSTAVFFGIRAEEVMILRDGEPLKPLLEPNILKGKVKSITEKTATHTIFFIDDREEIELEIELSNLVYRRLELFTGKSIQVSLKKSSIWISPEDFNKKYIVK